MPVTYPQTPASEPAADAAAPLTRPGRQFIVLLAMLQGLLLYVAEYGQDAGWWPFSSLSGCVYWYTLVLAVPTVMMLSVRQLGERRFWWQSAGVGVVFALLAAWAGWSASGAEGIRAASVLTPFGMAVAAALFVVLPYLQNALRYGRWSAHYPDLFELAWQNGLTLVLMGIFVGICWLLLSLWGELFKLIGIGFFADLFGKRPFFYLATGVMAGLGILIGRTQHRPVQIARRVLFAIFTGLLPLVAFIALLFAISLPFTGLQALWETRSAAAILMILLCVMVLFVNAVFQDGQDAAPYPRWLRHVVSAGILTLPLFAALALYALAQRIVQYGWTQDRIAAMAMAVILAAHALGYAIAVLRRGAWLAGVRRVNVAVSLLAIGLAVLFNSPVLDPHRITVNSQIARLEAGQVQAAEFDVDHLVSDSGRRGWLAAQALHDKALASGDSALAEQIATAQQRHKRRMLAEKDEEKPLTELAALQGIIKLAESSAAADDAWWIAFLGNDSLETRRCKFASSDCILLVRDFDLDGQSEHLLCELGNEFGIQCLLFAREAAGWQIEGELSFWEAAKVDDMRNALRKGEMNVTKHRWPMFEVKGVGAEIREHH